MEDIKVIFLDIDGVLNNAMDSDYHEAPDDDKFKQVHLLHSKRCVGLLNKLIEETNAKIVVSSTWRLGQTDESMESTLRCIGIKGGYLGMTKDLRYEQPDTFRGNEILRWVKDNKGIIGKDYYDFRSYVILDDDSDMLLWQKENYVNCDPEIGMTERTVFKAKSILLNAPCEDVGQEFVNY